jgi:hypothetical protein
MLSKPHRKFCEGIVSGLTGVRAYALAYPHCSLNTARINASQLRAKPHIQQEIARRRAQADAIVGSDVLILIEKRRWLARVVRANLAFLDPEIDGDLLVSLHVEERRKQPRVSKMRIANKLAAIRLDSRLAGDEPPKPKESTYAEKLLAAGGKEVISKPWGWNRVPLTAPKASPSNSGTPQEFKIQNSKFNIPPLPTSPDTPAPPSPITAPQSPESSNGSVDDSQDSAESHAPSDRQVPAEPQASADHEDRDPANSPQNSKFKIQNPTFPPEPPIDNGYVAPVYHPRPRFDPGADYYARQRAKRHQPVERHLW